jgi:hypothetical protein
MMRDHARRRDVSRQVALTGYPGASPKAAGVQLGKGTDETGA